MTDLPLTKIAENATTITLGWAPPVCIGYVFYRNGIRVSNTWDPTVSSIKFKKGDSYRVIALGVAAEGTYPAPIPPDPPVGTSNHLGIKQYTNYAPANFGYDRYVDYVCGEWAGEQASRELTTRVLPYTSAVSIRPDYWTCLDYNTAQAAGFFLKRSGVDIFNAGYPAAKIGDLGSNAYRQAWADAVILRAKAGGWNGVFIDDVTRASVESGLTNAFPDKYPTQAAWEAAMVGHILYVGAALKAAGLYVMVNAAGFVSGSPGWDNGSDTKAFATKLAPGISGFMVEYWMQRQDTMGVRTSGPAWFQQWEGWQSQVAHVEALGVDFIGLIDAAAGDSQVAVYAKASLLLDANRPGSCLVVDGDHGVTPWGPLIGKDMGAPLGAKTLLNGIWTRRFTNGNVTVNPAAGTATIT